jgi:GT2 family glycosyltransferase
VEYLPQQENLGYAGGANLIIQEARDCDHVLLLNPDVVPGEDFLAWLEVAFEASEDIGMTTGKLLQPTIPPRIDSTGLVVRRSRRIQDRGRDEVDHGQYALSEEVFGGTGAALMLSRAMLGDVAVDGEWFDAGFFAYYEDVDLAWRARLLGWRCLYVPEATAVHRRQFSPANRQSVSRERKRLATRNHLWLLVKNELPSLFLRDLAWIAPMEAARLLRALVVEPYCLPDLFGLGAHLKTLQRKRRWVMARRRVSAAKMGRWFQ